MTATRKYDVYGAVRGTTGTGTSNHKFVGSLGHPSEDGTGLIYMRARYYDPITGRFASEDAKLSGHNWFIYCSSNATNLIDSTGNEDEHPWRSLNLFFGTLSLLGGLAGSVVFRAAAKAFLLLALIPELALAGVMGKQGAELTATAVYLAVMNIAGPLTPDGVKMGPWAITMEVVAFYGGVGGLYALYIETI